MSRITPIIKINCINDNCPIPLIKTRKAIMKAKKGDIIEVIGTHPDSYKEIPMALKVQGIKVIKRYRKNNKFYKEVIMKKVKVWLVSEVGLIVVIGIILGGYPSQGHGYPPAVGIVGESRNCLACHVNNGPWKDDSQTIIDILDKKTRKSLKQKDGTFLIAVKKGEIRTVLTVIGCKDKKVDTLLPYRNAWLYIDPSRIKDGSIGNKFARGWEVNLNLGCRIVGDTLSEFKGAHISVSSMTIRPTNEAKDAELKLEVMLTHGESVKGKPKKGLISSYFKRKVYLKVEKKK